MTTASLSLLDYNANKIEIKSNQKSIISYRSDGKLIYLTINADSDTPISTTTNTDTSTTATNNNSDGGGEGGVSPSDVPPPTSDNTIEIIDNDIVETTTLDPTSYWYLSTVDLNNDTLICDYGVEYSNDMVVNGTSVDTTLFETRDDCCAAQPVACEDYVPSSDGGDDGGNSTTMNDENATTTTMATTTTGVPAEANSSESEPTSATTNNEDVPNEAPEGEENSRKLQASSDKSGRFIILNANNGNIVYSFNSRSDFTIRNHEFGPIGIAHRPTYGNYAGGEGNTNDVLMWGSASGSSSSSGSGGETLLFQLPKEFDSTSPSFSSPSLVDQFETRVMESVPWTTDTPPTFSKDGLAVYFLISGNRLTGWNNGRKFDIASNVGPVDLSTTAVSTDGGGSVQRPMVLTGDDKTLLVGVQDVMYGVDVSSTPVSIGWQSDAFGGGASFTTPQITPDGKMAYFGKSGAMHAINLNNAAGGGALLWEATNGYVDPFKATSQITMADFTLDSSGQILYYCHGGSDTITALRIGEEIPTDSPTLSPSGRPSVTASMSPSTSTAPTLSMVPTHGKDYIYPSASPSKTLSDAPSTSPTVQPTLSPTQSPYPTTSTGGVASQPEFVDAGSPTLDTTPTASSNNNTALLAGGSNPTSPASSKDDETTRTLPFSMPVIIGIGVGGGVVLILILGTVCYVCRKKPCSGGGEDDGVDTDWQSSDEAKQQMQFSGGGGEGQSHFQYSYGDEESDHRYGGERLKW